MQLNLFLFLLLLCYPPLLTQIPILRACDPPARKKSYTFLFQSILTKVTLFKNLFDMLNEAPFSIFSGRTVSALMVHEDSMDCSIDNEVA